MAARHDPETGGSDATVQAVILCDTGTERNGVGSYYLDLVSQLRERGTGVKLIAPDPDTAWRPYVPMPGDSTQRVFIPPAPSIHREVMRFRPRVVVAPTPGPYGWLGCVLAKRLGARLVASFHTHYERLCSLQSSLFVREVGRLGVSCAHRLMFQACDVTPTISSRLADVARQIGARNVRVVGTPVDPRFLERPTKPPSPSVARVLFAGRLAVEKRIDTVMHAAMELPDLEFEILGDGPMRGEVERYSRVFPNLHYGGWVPRERMPERMDAADLIVLPSVEESFGTVVLEAMARERPVLVSQACGILDWPGFHGALYSIREGETVAEAIRRVARERSADRGDRARRAKRLARELNARSLEDWLAVLRAPPLGAPA